jgi:hypothetical protein
LLKKYSNFWRATYCPNWGHHMTPYGSTAASGADHKRRCAPATPESDMQIMIATQF